MPLFHPKEDTKADAGNISGVHKVENEGTRFWIYSQDAFDRRGNLGRVARIDAVRKKNAYNAYNLLFLEYNVQQYCLAHLQFYTALLLRVIPIM